MAKPGDVIHGLDGEKLVFHQTAASTDGALLEVEVTYKPNSDRPPAHYHPNQEEHFQVLNGAISTWISGVERVYQPGEEFTIPATTPHAMHNSSDEQGRVMWQVRPALDTESLFETLWGLARDGKTGEGGTPSLLQIAVLFQAFSREIRLQKPPYVVQRILFGVLAPIGRLAGYQSHYL